MDITFTVPSDVADIYHAAIRKAPGGGIDEAVAYLDRTVADMTGRARSEGDNARGRALRTVISSTLHARSLLTLQRVSDARIAE